MNSLLYLYREIDKGKEKMKKQKCIYRGPSFHIGNNNTMVNNVWVVTYHFGRGHVISKNFISKQEAKRDVEITVFNNEDCINCTIYRHDLKPIEDMVQKTLADAFNANRKEWAK